MNRVLALALVCIALLCGTSAFAAGALDPSFGRGGIAEGPHGAFYDAVQDLRGRIVAVGRTYDQFGPGVPLVARLLSDGSRDPTFGVQGAVLSGCGRLCSSRWDAVTIAEDGKLVVAGDVLKLTPLGPESYVDTYSVEVARYLSNGAIDSSFRPDQFSARATQSLDIVAVADLKVLVAAVSAKFPNDERLLLARLDRDGALDPTFADGGTLETSLEVVNPTQLRLQSDGKVVFLAQPPPTGPGNYPYLIARVLSTGRLDPAFGSAGLVQISDAEALGLQPDGKIVVAAISTDDESRPILLRFDSAGRPDASFGDGGIAWAPGVGLVSDVLVQSDGKILTLASDFIRSDEWSITRFSADGSLDRSFGYDGVVTTEVPNAYLQLGLSLAGGGKLLVLGTTIDRFIPVRYLLDSVPAGRRPLPLRRVLPSR